jgi:hypothetical protein
MLVEVIVNRNSFSLRNLDSVISVRAFREVYEKYGAHGMAYVSYMSDSDNELYCYLPEKLRNKEAQSSTKITEQQSKDAVFSEAIEKYKALQLGNPYSKMKRGLGQAMDKLADYMLKKTGKEITELDVEPLMKMAIDTPKVLKAFDDASRIAQREEKKGRVTSNRELSLAEEEYT